MNKNHISALLVAIVLLASCDKVPTPEPAGPVNFDDGFSAWILNNGTGNNDASISLMTVGKDGILSLEPDVYLLANDKKLGDLAQDLILYGDRLYVTVTNSSKVEKLDKNCNVLQSLSITTEEGVPSQPRFLAADGGYVYFSAYDGFLHCLDTLTLSESKVEIGGALEALCITDDKIFVNISRESGSGYIYDNKVAVVSTKDKGFELLSVIEGITNPYTTCFATHNGVYVTSQGDYGENPDQLLYLIDSENYEFIEMGHATYAAPLSDGSIAVVYNYYYDSSNARNYIYDPATHEETSFECSAGYPYALQSDPGLKGFVVFDCDYTAPAHYLLFYSEDGDFLESVASGGLYPSKFIIK